jgi:MFS transporter
LAAGLLLAALGLALFARAPVDGGFTVDVLPGMILLGLGAGTAFNPVLLAAMSDVAPTESGLASGMVNTSFMMGGALGLAVLASLAAARTDGMLASGQDALAALNGGYHVAFALGAVFAAAAALLGACYCARGCRPRPAPGKSRPASPRRPKPTDARTSGAAASPTSNSDGEAFYVTGCDRGRICCISWSGVGSLASEREDRAWRRK